MVDEEEKNRKLRKLADDILTREGRKILPPNTNFIEPEDRDVEHPWIFCVWLDGNGTERLSADAVARILDGGSRIIPILNSRAILGSFLMEVDAIHNVAEIGLRFNLIKIIESAMTEAIAGDNFLSKDGDDISDEDIHEAAFESAWYDVRMVASRGPFLTKEYTAVMEAEVNGETRLIVADMTLLDLMALRGEKSGCGCSIEVRAEDGSVMQIPIEKVRSVPCVADKPVLTGQGTFRNGDGQDIVRANLLRCILDGDSRVEAKLSTAKQKDRKINS